MDVVLKAIKTWLGEGTERVQVKFAYHENSLVLLCGVREKVSTNEKRSAQSGGKSLADLEDVSLRFK